MTYYQILKQRRLDLNLSVQDISIHTHLAPEYIRAIEDHNLDVFSDDFSFVRYFVHSYCDAIGVNWEAVVREVDADITAYARMRDQALTDAQRRMVETMPSASQKKTTHRKKKSRFVNSAASLSRKLNWDSSNRLSRLVVGAAIVGLVALVTLSSIMDAVNAKNRENAQIAQQTELQKKEQETQRLAEERKNQKGTETQKEFPAPQIQAADQKNAFYIAGLISEETPMQIRIVLEEPSAVTISSNGVVLTQENVRQEFTYEASVESARDLSVVIDSWNKDDTLEINGKRLSLQSEGLSEGQEATVLLHVVSALPKKDSQADQPAAGQETDPGQGQDGVWQTEPDAASEWQDPYGTQTWMDTDVTDWSNAAGEDGYYDEWQ